MGRATDPGENHDPGKDQRFTPNLTQAPRLENSLGEFWPFAATAAKGEVAPRTDLEAHCHPFPFRQARQTLR